MQSGIVGCIIFRIIAWTQVLALSRASFRQSLASTDLGSRSGAAFGSFGESPNYHLQPRGGGRVGKDLSEKGFIAKVTHNKHLYTFQNENS